MKRSNYRMTFKFTEEQLFGIGEEYDFLAKIFTKEIKPQELDRSIVYYSRKLGWVTRLIVELGIIYNDVNEITQKIIDHLYMRGDSFEKTSNELGVSLKRLVRQHHLIVDEVIELMGMRVRLNENDKRSSRYIPASVKRQVFERDAGRCVKCHSEGKLHFHHIKRFSEGGQETVDNLTLLCVSCHTEEHKGEKAYHMLKSNIKE